MTWAEVAAEHIGHRCVLDDPRTLRCVDCTRKLLIPLRAEDAPTPTPPRGWKRPAPEQCVPMPSGMKEQVLAEIRARAARRASRLSPTEQPRDESETP